MHQYAAADGAVPSMTKQKTTHKFTWNLAKHSTRFFCTHETVKQKLVTNSNNDEILMHKLPQAAHVAASALPFACVKHHQLVHPCQEKKPAHKKEEKTQFEQSEIKHFSLLGFPKRKEVLNSKLQHRLVTYPTSVLLLNLTTAISELQMLGQVQFCSWWRTEESSSTIVIRILQLSTMMNPEPVNTTKENHRVLLLKLLQIKKKIGNSKLGLRLTMLSLKQEELCQAEQLLLDSSSC